MSDEKIEKAFNIVSILAKGAARSQGLEWIYSNPPIQTLKETGSVIFDRNNPKFIRAHNAQETRTSEEPVVNNGVTAIDESKQ